MQLQITYYSPEAHSVIPPNSQLTLLDGQCKFTEGPVWHPDGFYLFSDIPENVIYRIKPGKQKEVYHQHAGFEGDAEEQKQLSEQIGSNGLCLHPQGGVVVCRHGAGSVGLLENGKWSKQYETYEGKRFNSPNDVVVAKDGSIYFTDPPYGLKDQQLNAHFAQPVAGAYAIVGEQLHRFNTGHTYPNGICLSADEQLIYVCSNKPVEKFISIFDRNSLKEVGRLAEENSDGLKMDRAGNFWLCTKEGLVVLSAAGKRLLKLELPTIPANLCFGAGEQEVFITARQNVFLLTLGTA